MTGQIKFIPVQQQDGSWKTVKRTVTGLFLKGGIAAHYTFRKLEMQPTFGCFDDKEDSDLVAYRLSEYTDRSRK